MNPHPDPQPGIPFQKPNGSWTFYIYPDGVQREAAEFVDEATANEASVTALRIWEANDGKQFGPVSVITKQTFISGM
jgi:hypothetical protein